MGGWGGEVLVLNDTFAALSLRGKVAVRHQTDIYLPGRGHAGHVHVLRDVAAGLNWKQVSVKHC